MTIPELLAHNLKKQRAAHGLTQAELAEALNLHPTHISSMERGVKFPSTVTLEQICRYYGMRPYQLFLEEGVDDVPENTEATIARFSMMLMKDLPVLIKERIHKSKEDLFKNH